MSTEIEAKLKVDSLEDVKQKLVELGAEFLAEHFQPDCYFDDAGSTLKNSDRALRLRRQLTGKTEKVLLTYKGAKTKDNFKKRQEIEIEIKDAESAEKLLLSLGYEKVLVFEKKRLIWQVENCVVALDKLPLLGNFVEIEGPDDKEICDVQRNLGLADLPHIVESYADLVAKKGLK
ncbi:MAG: class IV adenylate cyclase [Sedimentisphaerales bacterium]